MADSTQNQNEKSIEEELEEYLREKAAQQNASAHAAPQSVAGNVAPHSTVGNMAPRPVANRVVPQPVAGNTPSWQVPANAVASKPASAEDDGRRSFVQNDLLSQIAAEDKKEEAGKKKSHNQVPISKMLSIFMMRMTLLLDEIQHKYAMPIKMLELVWCVFIAIIYMGGIASLVILVNVYLSYPRYVSDYFQDNNIELSSWNMGSYTLSRIELNNLKSKDNSYSIRKVVIRSGFSDFLRGRIKTVSLEGTVLNVKENGASLEWRSLAKLLMKLNQSSSNRYKIGSISIPNAVLNVEGETYKLPIQLSINGVYEHTPSVSIPLSIKQEYMNVSGLLSMSGSGQNLEWTLDNLSGNLSFPNRQPENIAGKFKIKTDGMSVSAINGNLNLTYGKNKKSVKVDLKKNKDLFRGTVGISLINQEVRDKANETKTEMQMVFEGLDIKRPSRISSKEPIQFNVLSFNGYDVNLSNAAGVFRGDLNCFNFVCDYEIKSDVPVSVQSSRFVYHGSSYASSDKTLFTLMPSKGKSVILTGDGIGLSLRMKNASYTGKKNKNNDIKLNVKSMGVNGEISLLNQVSNLVIETKDADYSSNTLEFTGAQIDIDDILNEGTGLRFVSPSVSFKNNSLVKVPFAIDMRREKGVVGALLSMIDNKLQIRYLGTADFLSGSFDGNVAVLPFDLKNVTNNLNSISDIFPGAVSNVSGKLAVFGKIGWKSEKQVAGPFYLMAKNVGFKVGNMDVKDLNTVLVVQSLVPFITPSGQEVFIGGVDSVMPFRNINATLKFDNQLMRIAKLNAQVGGLPLSMDNVIMQYRTSSTILALKNSEADFSSMNKYWNIAGLTVDGKGSVLLPLELKDNMFRVANGEVKLVNVDIKYTGKDNKIRNSLFKNSNGYLLRSGSIMLTQSTDNTLDAYLNFEGRMLPNQIKSTYAKTVSFDLNSLFKDTVMPTVPTPIQQRQQSIEAFLKKQK